ncbi:hypothetical protein [Bacillus sp. 2205SS5-2]|uniref:hypothetical protein n=1 Tax=Bacillus sp. 2205SS5-2 TaxID=3109031 RepID=UPI003005CFC5
MKKNLSLVSFALLLDWLLLYSLNEEGIEKLPYLVMELSYSFLLLFHLLYLHFFGILLNEF